MSHKVISKTNMKFMYHITFILTPKVSFYVTQLLRHEKIRLCGHIKNGSQTNTLYPSNEYVPEI